MVGIWRLEICWQIDSWFIDSFIQFFLNFGAIKLLLHCLSDSYPIDEISVYQPCEAGESRTIPWLQVKETNKPDSPHVRLSTEDFVAGLKNQSLGANQMPISRRTFLKLSAMVGGLENNSTARSTLTW
jgi:hypothetical protein